MEYYRKKEGASAGLRSEVFYFPRGLVTSTRKYLRRFRDVPDRPADRVLRK